MRPSSAHPTTHPTLLLLYLELRSRPIATLNPTPTARPPSASPRFSSPQLCCVLPTLVTAIDRSSLLSSTLLRSPYPASCPASNPLLGHGQCRNLRVQILGLSLRIVWLVSVSTRDARWTQWRWSRRPALLWCPRSFAVCATRAATVAIGRPSPVPRYARHCLPQREGVDCR